MNRSASSTPTRRNSEIADGLHGKPSDTLTPFNKSTSLKSLNATSPHPPSKPRDLKDGTEKGNVASNDVHMGFEGDPVKTPTNGIRGSNLSSRKR